MAIGMNLVALFLTLSTAEGAIFALSKYTAMGETMMGVLLYPKHWSTIAAQQKQALDKMVPESSYYVHDPLLGWTLGPSRGNPTAKEITSSEGLRAPRVGMSFGDAKSRHSGASSRPASVRIALIGDSMTFGYEVRCEETWGHALEDLLQPHVQVLNFGVSGFGLNQTVLQYEQVVRSWHPHIVIVGISSEMVRRINSIYTPLMNPEWGNAFARPRLVMTNGIPSAVNLPVLKPGELLGYATIQEFPHRDLDAYYRPLQWERGGIWYAFEHSYVFRFLNSIRPPAEAYPKDIEDEAIESSQLATRYLVRKILEDGAVPFVVRFPYAYELGISNSPSAHMLHDADIEYYDSAECLAKAGKSDAYMAGGHYSPKGNGHIAQCLKPIVRAQTNNLRH